MQTNQPIYGLQWFDVTFFPVNVTTALFVARTDNGKCHLRLFTPWSVCACSIASQYRPFLLKFAMC